MNRNLKKRKASLMNVIQALDEADEVFGEDIELDSLDEQLPEELDSEDLEPLAEDAELPEDETMETEDSDEFEVAEDEIDEDPMELPEDKDDEEILSDDENEEILSDDEDDLDEDEDKGDEEILSDDEDDLSFLDEVEEEEKTTASETTPGIEDEIGDEANGGDPSVSEVAEGGDDVDVSTDGEVFPTESEYVARIVSRLDRVANYLEKKGQKKMAYRIDLLSDKLEASVKK